MANLEHLAIIKSGVSEWNQWRKQNPYAMVDLTDADLSGLDLSFADIGGMATAKLWGVNFSMAQLEHTNLRVADLRNANMFGANLAFADLTLTNLMSANLTATNLPGVTFSQNNLHKANFKHANLGSAKFHLVDLSEVSLKAANLSLTSFNDCSFDNTEFESASLQSTMFANVDLSSAKGLDTVKHSGRSNIDINTLIRSEGKIPEIFLRGCGLPEVLIAYLPSLTNKAIEFYSCFISYNHKDKVFAQRVHDTLQGRGIRCWLDEKQVNPGDDIYREIERGIRYWDKVLLCASEHSLTSWWVDHELDTLFEKERGLTKLRGDKVLALIPLNVDGFLFTPECKTPKKQQIQSRIAADFKGWQHDNDIFEREIEMVIKALRTDGGKEVPPPTLL